MDHGRFVRIGPLTFHFSALNLLLWAIGLAFLGQMALAGGFATGSNPITGSFTIESLWAGGADGPRSVFHRLEWWRLIAAVFLHAGVMHFLFNGFALYQLGRIAEVIYGPKRLVLAFLATGIVSSLTSDVWLSLREDGGISIGASGAVFGVMGLLLAHMRRRVDVVGRMVGRQLTVWAVINLVIGFLLPVVNNAAHIGGFVSGYLLSFVLREGHVKMIGGSTEERAVKASLVVLCGLTIVALLIAGTGAQARLRFIEDARPLGMRLNEAATDITRGRDVSPGALASVRGVQQEGTLGRIRAEALPLLEQPTFAGAARLRELANQAYALYMREVPDVPPPREWWSR